MTTFLVLVLSGCGLLHHKDQLLLMADFSRDKNVQDKIVKDINTKYDALVGALEEGKISKYPDQASILTNFGKPIAKKTVLIEGKEQQQWLYRHAIPHKAKDKVYLYFDSKGHLINYHKEQIQWT